MIVYTHSYFPLRSHLKMKFCCPLHLLRNCPGSMNYFLGWALIFVFCFLVSWAGKDNGSEANPDPDNRSITPIANDSCFSLSPLSRVLSHLDAILSLSSKFNWNCTLILFWLHKINYLWKASCGSSDLLSSVFWQPFVDLVCFIGDGWNSLCIGFFISHGVVEFCLPVMHIILCIWSLGFFLIESIFVSSSWFVSELQRFRLFINGTCWKATMCLNSLVKS